MIRTSSLVSRRIAYRGELLSHYGVLRTDDPKSKPGEGLFATLCEEEHVAPLAENGATMMCRDCHDVFAEIKKDEDAEAAAKAAADAEAETRKAFATR